MNGAESLIRTAIAAGVEVCFANPGTTEMPLVAALDSADGLRPILGLFEGVCTGAADGYGRMAEKPAMTLLHLGPGFANGIANLHNARRARSPIVNLIGDHATWHVGADAPLTSDIVSLATPVSGWVRSVRTAASLADTTAQAIAAAGRAPGQIATLIIPSDCQWDPAERHAARNRADGASGCAPPTRSSSAAESIRKGNRVALFLGGTGASRTRPEGGCAHRGQVGMSSDMRNVSRATRARRGNAGARSPALLSRAGDRDAEGVRYDRHRRRERASRVFRLSRFSQPADS